jgi:hypothetical protein
LELSVENTIAENFLHHLFLRGKAVCASNIVGFLHLGNSCTVLEFGAFSTSSRVLIRSAFFRYEMALFSKVRMEMRPSSFTTFSHIIAIKQELW